MQKIGIGSYLGLISEVLTLGLNIKQKKTEAKSGLLELGSNPIRFKYSEYKNALNKLPSLLKIYILTEDSLFYI